MVEVPYPPGFSRGRLDQATVVKKFHDLTAAHLAQAERDHIVESVMTLDKKPTCIELMKALAGPAS